MLAKKQVVINWKGFECNSPLHSDLNYPVGASLDLDEKEEML